jgi:copper chaperone
MYELQVEGMSCSHCVAAVTKAVQAVDTSASVEVDLADKQVRVVTKAALDQIKSAIDEAGYEVSAAHVR